MNQDESESDNSTYVNWKGWIGQTPFGQLDAGDKQYFKAELRNVLARGDGILNVLEIGFGNGSFLSYCRAEGWNVTGSELEPDLVEAGEASGFAVCLPDQVDQLPDRSFDLIALFDVLEHIPQDDIVDFLSSLESKLSVRGVMLLRFPNADSWLGNPLQNGDPTHVTAIGYLKMTYFALQAGLEVTTFRGARRRGFSTSFTHGLYRLIAGPIISAWAFVKRTLYFPGLPVVLATSNVVCVLRARAQP